VIISRLSLQNFRNLREVNLHAHPHFNVFFGENGAGKTSILEAIYFLSHGRSFRSNQLNRLVTKDQAEFILFSEIQHEDKHSIGMSRHIQGEAKNRLNGRALQSTVEIARLLPTLLFDPQSFELLTAGSKGRRQMLDWGVFYQKQDYIHLWQAARNVLKQRNAALRAGHNKDQLQLWDPILIESAEQIDSYRSQYIDGLVASLTSLLGEFLESHQIQMSYFRGWPKDESLQSCLERSLEQDRKHGLTHYGPHRADIKFKIHNQPAADILSRGQQKTLICAIKLAQGMLFKQQTGKSCVYLLDDIASELDHNHLKQIMQQLQQLGSQVFMTSIQESALIPILSPDELASFRVSNGQISALKHVPIA